MIMSFTSKALKELFETGSSSKIKQDLQKRAFNRLHRLEQIRDLSELNLPGFKPHPLNGFTPTRYAISVNGPWRITFEFKNGDVYNVDIEQYH